LNGFNGTFTRTVKITGSVLRSCTVFIICQIFPPTDTSVFPFTVSTLHNYIGRTLARAPAES